MTTTISHPSTIDHNPSSLVPSDLTIRWMIARDLPRVLRIERDSFAHPWRHEDFACRLGLREGVISYVAELEDLVVGYLIRLLRPSHDEIINLAVDRDCRRLGIGSHLIENLKRRLAGVGRNRIVVYTQETNLGAQLFFRSAGFRATKVVHHFYRKTDAAAYRFVCRARPSAGKKAGG